MIGSKPASSTYTMGIRELIKMTFVVSTTNQHYIMKHELQIEQYCCPTAANDIQCFFRNFKRLTTKENNPKLKMLKSRILNQKTEKYSPAT